MRAVGLLTMFTLLVVAVANVQAQRALDPRQTVEKYIASALAGKVKDASALADPEKKPAREREIKELKKLIGRKSLQVASVHRTEKGGRAIARTEVIRLTEANPDGTDRGCLLISMRWQGGKWLINDIDFHPVNKAREKVDSFVKKYADASEVKPREK
jgi:hypothetical protein